MDLDPSKTAFLFPDQGSQAVGMGQDLAAAFPVARATFAAADAFLGESLSEIIWNGPAEELDATIHTQPALLVHSVAVLRVFWGRHADFHPALTAGHSMGEISALVASGVLPFEDALDLVRQRGVLMQEAGQQSPGGMVALLGLEIPAVEEICQQASQGEEVVQIANDNCPGQVVVSGSGAALRRLLPLARHAGARKMVPLKVSIAAHSPLMAHAQAGFNRAVDAAPLRDPGIPILGNVSAQPLRRARDVEDDLKAQLTSRVRWTESIQYMLAQGLDTFVEIGSGSVLLNLVKRIDRQSRRFSLDKAEDFLKLESN